MKIITILEIFLVLVVPYNIVQDSFYIVASRHSEIEYVQDGTIQLWGFLFVIGDASFLSLVTGLFLYANWSTKMASGFSIGGVITSVLSTAIESFLLFLPQWLQFFAAYEYAQYMMAVNQ